MISSFFHYLHSRYTKVYFQLSIVTIGIILSSSLFAGPISYFKRLDSLSNNKLIVFPVISYLPDNNWTFGVGGVDYFRVVPQTETNTTRLSLVRFMGGYSLTKVKELWTTWNVFLKNDTYFFKGESYYKKIPDKFYGIGNNSLSGNIERYSYETVNLKTYFLKKLPKKIFAGITYQFQYVYHLKFDPSKELIRNLITGTKGGINSGLGICMIYDTRNNSVNPQSGNYIEFYNTINTKILGSDYSFSTFSFVAKKYISVYKNNIIGLHYLLTTNDGNTPFFSMSFLGSEEILRGYPKNRYRDLSSTAFQIEYRSPIWNRMGFVCFTGLGEVSKSIHYFSWLKLKPSYGAGLRIAISQKERLNVRLDYAFGYKISSFYLSIGEAF